MNKYRNTPTVVDNVRFDSKAESIRYSELKLLLKAKQIKNLKIHPKYELLPKGENIWRQKYRGITYEADFEYVEKYDGDICRLVIEDVKGMITDVYSLKKRLFMKFYPNYKFVEIK